MADHRVIESVFPVVKCSSSFLKGRNDDPVGIKLICFLCAEKAKRLRLSSITGDPHLIASVALGPTDFKIVPISCSICCASGGEFLMYRQRTPLLQYL